MYKHTNIQYINALRRAEEMIKRADEEAIASLNSLAQQCQDYLLKTTLSDWATQIQVCQYANQFLQEF